MNLHIQKNHLCVLTYHQTDKRGWKTPGHQLYTGPGELLLKKAKVKVQKNYTKRRVSSGFGLKSSLPLTKSIYNGGSCSTKGRTCFIIGGLRFPSCFIAISAYLFSKENFNNNKTTTEMEWGGYRPYLLHMQTMNIP